MEIVYGIAAGTVFGVIGVIAVIIIGALLWFRKKGKNKVEKE